MGAGVTFNLAGVNTHGGGISLFASSRIALLYGAALASAFSRVALALEDSQNAAMIFISISV